jgi:hypothetical protein
MKRSWRFRTFVMAGAMVMAGTLVMASESAFGANELNSTTGARWQGAIANVPLPGEGCFAASYPALEWHATQCKVAPELPFEPAMGNPSAPASPLAAKPVGNGNDYSAVVVGPITEATGSFANVSPDITEKGQYGGSGPKLPNTFSPAQHAIFYGVADVLRK